MFSLHKEMKDKIKNYSVKTKMGRNPTKPNKVNQDSYLMLSDFCNLTSVYYFGIFDGHGLFGSQASDLVKRQLPRTFVNLKFI